MPRINIKHLTVNQAWKGRRYKTDKYKKYERDLLLILPKTHIPEGKLYIAFKVGFSSKLADIDNPIKPFQDIMCKKYGFDDRRVYKMTIEKEIVGKGKEYIDFEVFSYEL